MFETSVVWWLGAVMWVGAISALLTGLLALVEKDLKRVLAFSTVSQLGYMMAGVGAASIFASQFHLLNHAIFKALLFLCAGAVIHAVHTRSMYQMGGLKRSMPLVHWTFLFGTLALAGIPIFNGFWSKDAIFEALLEHHNYGVLGMLILTALLTAAYSWRMYWLTFQGEPRAEAEPHDPAWQMAVPLGVLGVGAVISWVYVDGYATNLVMGLPYHPVSEIGIASLIRHTFTSPLLLVAGVAAAIMAVLGTRWRATGPPVPAGPQIWADVVTDTKAFGDWFWGFWAVAMKTVGMVLSLFQSGDLNYNNLWLAIGFIAVLLMFLGWG